ncbi:DUF692 domain-containing protein [uncultured Ferrimonas sp.]|uniref:DUF692 domain-containing protein n=1 Tax=uncultured Ferrimonas sp. TaxID=432640 RepID=UPI002633BF4E|nr:DUF692 domain-containing protein [uncultured Ferrimonas sp.]
MTALPQVAAQAVSFSVREPHLQQILQRQLSLPFIEVMADNYLSLRGPHYHRLCQLAERYPVVLHCVGLSVGSGGAADDYLTKLAIMADELNAIAISDHLSVSQLAEGDSHDLLPLCYQRDLLPALQHSIERLQHRLPLPLILENVSRYLSYRDDNIGEGELLAELHRRTGIGLLLDINNLYVSAHNLQCPVAELLAKLPLTAVSYCHLAGHQPQGELLLDHHGSQVSEPVWQLYQQLLAQMGPRPTIIEWDNHLPPLDTLLGEVARARRYQEQL